MAMLKFRVQLDPYNLVQTPQSRLLQTTLCLCLEAFFTAAEAGSLITHFSDFFFFFFGGGDTSFLDQVLIQWVYKYILPKNCTFFPKIAKNSDFL